MYSALSKYEKANVLTHVLGLLASLLAIPILFVIAGERNTSWHLLAAIIYSVTLVLTFSASVAYHMMIDVKLKKLFRIIDHICIFLMIGGSYTPVILIFINKPSGWIFYSVLWILIVFGIIYKLFFTNRSRLISATIYIFLGSLFLFILDSMLTAIPNNILWLLGIGSVSYFIGGLFYLRRSLPYHHAIWHIFVLIAMTLHFIAYYQAFQQELFVWN